MITSTFILIASLLSFEIPTCGGDACEKAGGIRCLEQKLDTDNDGENDLAGRLCGLPCKNDSYCDADDGQECVYLADFGDSFCVKLCTFDEDCHAGQFCDTDYTWPEVQGCFWGQG